MERVKAEAAQAREKLLKEMQMKHEQLLSEKERSHQEYVKQMRKMIEAEEALKRAEELRVMDHKYQVFELYYLLHCLHFLFLNYVYMCESVCGFVYMCMGPNRPEEGCQIPWSWSYRWL